MSQDVDSNLLAESGMSVLLFFTLKDIPGKQEHLDYRQIFKTMGQYVTTEPVLIQASLVSLLAGTVQMGEIRWIYRKSLRSNIA